MATEQVTLAFTDDAIDALADIAVQVNSTVENIGVMPSADRNGTRARRHLVRRSDKAGQTVSIDRAYVTREIAELANNVDLSKFIL